MEQNLESASKLHIILLLGKLQTIKKGFSPIDEYLLIIHNLSNQLALMASPIMDTNRFYYTLGGLGPKYKSFVTTISLQADDLPLEGLSSSLQSNVSLPFSLMSPISLPLLPPSLHPLPPIPLLNKVTFRLIHEESMIEVVGMVFI